jgi:alpha-tubulin suppressor-like RCC1 family protein
MVGVTAPAGQCPTSATSVCASDGTCAAGGACNYPSTTVSCGIGCSGDTSGAFSCDGAGNCSGAGHALHRCANNFVCASPTACATSCTTDAQCQPGYFCQNAACIAAQAIGAACTGVDQCASGFCVGGYCCNTACTTECNSCDGTLTGGSNGVCTTVRDGVSDPQGTCPISPDGTCGTSGQCVGGACGLKGSGWECPGTCSNNIETLGFCDGAGNCNISTSTNSCAPNGCAATGCATSCQTSADCASPAVCFNNTCIRVAALAIGPGGSHTCALRYGGVVNCWGAGTLGQLGNGATANSSVPVSVSVITTLDSTTRLCAGDNHTCALLSGGSVYCWGNNASGQLGTNPATTSISPTPISVGGLPGSITSLACGGSHTCALTSTGAVWCWGANASGQLGNGSLTATFNPTQVSNITTASGVVGGEAHTCALTGSGVQCWGLNANGQLGNGSTISSSTPVTVTGLSAKSLAAGAQHNCAVTSTGGVSCWGLGSSGQCGNAVQNNTAPVAVTNSGGSALTGVVAVAAGTSQTCAVLTGGGVACWGSDIDGNLGNGMTTQSSTPVTPSGPITGATAVAGGLYHTCAITNGTVDCWGFNGSGQLGNNTTTQSLTPVTVSGP